MRPTHITKFSRMLWTTALVASPAVLAIVSPTNFGKIIDSIETTATAVFMSNPFLQDDTKEITDSKRNIVAAVVDPTLRFKAGDSDSRYTFESDVGLSIRRAKSSHGIDSEDFHTALSASFQGTRAWWNLNASFTELSLPDFGNRETSALIHRSLTTVGWTMNYRFSERTRFIAGLQYQSQRYNDTTQINYNDWSSFSVPIELLYRVTENLEIGGGVRYRKISEELNENSDDTVWYLSAVKNITDKFSLTLQAGLSNENFGRINGSNESNLFFSARTNWQVTPDTSLSLYASRDSSSTNSGIQVLREELEWGTSWRISHRLSASSALSFTKIIYENDIRVDDISRASASLIYESNERLYSTFSISYEKSDSTITEQSYSNLVGKLKTGWRF